MFSCCYVTQFNVLFISISSHPCIPSLKNGLQIRKTKILGLIVGEGANDLIWFSKFIIVHCSIQHVHYIVQCSIHD